MNPLTADLDLHTLWLTEQEALARNTTLPEVVAQQLRVMARKWQQSGEGKSPVTDALRGAVPCSRISTRVRVIDATPSWPSCPMATKKKTFDAVAQSRRWRVQTGRGCVI